MRNVKPASGLVAGALLAVLGGFAGCGPNELCGHSRSCGSKTLFACMTDDTDRSDYRYKSSDGDSWSCTGTRVWSTDGTTRSWDTASCKVAAQEAADWCFSQSGAAAATPTTRGQLVITELMYDPTVVADEDGEWFEIYSLDSQVLDLFGCEIRNLTSAHTIAAHFIIPPRAYRTAAAFATGGGFTPDYTYSGITFNNDAADEVSIRCGSTLISRFGYAPERATTGRTLSFDPSGFANANGNTSEARYICPATSVYNTSATGGDPRDWGTPGKANPPCRQSASASTY